MERVAGNTLFRLKGYVIEAHGPHAWERVVEQVEPTHQATLRGVILSKRWYDRTLYQGLLAGIDEALGREALIRSAEVQAKRQFGGFFGLVLRMIPLSKALDETPDYWRKTWTGGELRAVSRPPDPIELMLRDFELPEVHRVHNERYMKVFIEALSGKAHHSSSESRGPRAALFRYTPAKG